MKVHGLDRQQVVETIILARQPTRQFATVEQIG
jgi:3-hydroxybutyrate dehydrogenase